MAASLLSAPSDRAGAVQDPLACPPAAPPAATLPAAAREKLLQSIEKARPHASHVWRDLTPVNPDGTVNVYVEIARGSSEKHEFDIAANRRALDRVIPASLGGYPTGYGFVPRTIGVDGDPFDGLVIGGAAAAGTVVPGHVLGLMYMTDEKGSDAKVVVTPERDAERRKLLLTEAEKDRIATFFGRYKAIDEDPGTFACVPGWGDEAEARRHVMAAARLYETR
jgi:inorganic pyrophosphatase